MLFPMDYLMVLNIAVIAILILFTYSGYKQGFLLKALGILSFIVCAFLAWWLSSPLAKLLHLLPEDLTPMKDSVAGPIFYDSINRILVFALLCLLLCILVSLLKPLFHVVGSLPLVSQVNTVLGILFGAIQGLVVIMIITFIFGTPLFANGTRVIDESILKPISATSNRLLFFASDQLAELQAVQKIVTPSTILSEEDLAHIKSWLLSHDLPESQVDAFLAEIVGDVR